MWTSVLSNVLDWNETVQITLSLSLLTLLLTTCIYKQRRLRKSAFSTLKNCSDTLEADLHLRTQLCQQPPRPALRQSTSKNTSLEPGTPCFSSEEDVEGRPFYLAPTDESAASELTTRMVEQGFLVGRSRYSDEDFRYSHTFCKLTKKLGSTPSRPPFAIDDDEEVKEEV